MSSTNKRLSETKKINRKSIPAKLTPASKKTNQNKSFQGTNSDNHSEKRGLTNKNAYKKHNRTSDLSKSKLISAKENTKLDTSTSNESSCASRRKSSRVSKPVIRATGGELSFIT